MNQKKDMIIVTLDLKRLWESQRYKKIDIVMPMYNLIEYSDADSKTSGSLWKYYRDEPALDNNGNIIDFPANNNNSASFKFKQEITWQTGNGGTKDVEIMVPLKYLNNFLENNWNVFN